MEQKDILIIEEAPPDTSTYIDGVPDAKEEPLKDEPGSISFSDMVKETNINE